jgi:hypothetical protein
VDAQTGAAICDPTFTVKPATAGEKICDPTGDPRQLQAFDGAATCTFILQSLNGIEVPVDIQVVAPGYTPSVVSMAGCLRDGSYLASLTRASAAPP